MEDNNSKKNSQKNSQTKIDMKRMFQTFLPSVSSPYFDFFCCHFFNYIGFQDKHNLNCLQRKKHLFLTHSNDFESLKTTKSKDESFLYFHFSD